jgi:hypothetical protein
VAVNDLWACIVYRSEANCDILVKHILVGIVPITCLEEIVATVGSLNQLEGPCMLMETMLVKPGKSTLYDSILRPVVQVLPITTEKMPINPARVHSLSESRAAGTFWHHERIIHIKEIRRPLGWLPWLKSFGLQRSAIAADHEERSNEALSALRWRLHGLHDVVSESLTIACRRAAHHNIRTPTGWQRDPLDKSWEVVNIDAILG